MGLVSRVRTIGNLSLCPQDLTQGMVYNSRRMFADESYILQSDWADSAEVERHLVDPNNPVVLEMVEWKPKAAKRPG